MSPLRFFTAEDPDMARVRAIRRQVFVQDLGVPEQQEFDAADLPGADTVYALLTAEGSPLGTGRLQGAAENYKIGRIAFLPAARRQGSGRRLVTALVRRAAEQGAYRVPVDARLEAVVLREVGICALRRAVYAAGYAPFANGIDRGGTAPPVGRERP